MNLFTALRLAFNVLELIFLIVVIRDHMIATSVLASLIVDIASILGAASPLCVAHHCELINDPYHERSISLTECLLRASVCFGAQC